MIAAGYMLGVDSVAKAKDYDGKLSRLFHFFCVFRNFLTS